MDYKDPQNRDALWQQLCTEKRLDRRPASNNPKGKCVGRSHTYEVWSGGLTDYQKWVQDNFSFLYMNIVRYFMTNNRFKSIPNVTAGVLHSFQPVSETTTVMITPAPDWVIIVEQA